MGLAKTPGRMLARKGQPWTILRKTQATNAQPWKSSTVSLAFDYVQARERHFKPVELRGGIQEGDVLIVATPAQCCTAPKAGDRIAPGTHYNEDGAEWRHVIAVHEAREAGAGVVYRIQARR